MCAAGYLIILTGSKMMSPKMILGSGRAGEAYRQAWSRFRFGGSVS